MVNTVLSPNRVIIEQEEINPDLSNRKNGNKGPSKEERTTHCYCEILIFLKFLSFSSVPTIYLISLLGIILKKIWN